MSLQIPDTHIDLLSDQSKTIAFLATIMKDDSPQVTPIWFNWDGNYIWINSAKGRVKDRNMRHHPEVALVIPDTMNAGRYIQLRGVVVSITEEGALEHANLLALKYTGQPWMPMPEQVRVKYKIKPEHVMAWG